MIVDNDDDGGRQTPSDDNSSLGHWPGELKIDTVKLIQTGHCWKKRKLPAYRSGRL